METQIFGKIEFVWTDEDVIEFCRVYTIGGYTDDYKDCKTIEKKMNKFKQLKKNNYEK